METKIKERMKIKKEFEKLKKIYHEEELYFPIIYVKYLYNAYTYSAINLRLAKYTDRTYIRIPEKRNFRFVCINVSDIFNIISKSYTKYRYIFEDIAEFYFGVTIYKEEERHKELNCKNINFRYKVLKKHVDSNIAPYTEYILKRSVTKIAIIHVYNTKHEGLKYMFSHIKEKCNEMDMKQIANFIDFLIKN